VLLEVSPHPVLTAAMQETIDDAGASPHTRIVASRRRRPERFLQSLGQLFVDGVDPD
jgi:acyl transferase domain-containing protein